MFRFASSFLSVTAAVTLICIAPLSHVCADDDAKVDGQTYLLRHSIADGQQLHFEVTHMAKTKTRIEGTEDVSQVHTISHRHWDVVNVDGEKMTFDHIVDTVEMTQQQGDKEEVRWSSTSGEIAPTMFGKVAEQIGEKLSTVTINPRGQETDREDFGGSKANLGMGSLVIAFPEEPIAIGGSWAVPREVKTRTEEATMKIIKIRELYTLEKVKSGVATISIRSEPLTPMDDESIRAQVVQQLSNGTIKFDMDNGHLLNKELNWDETVVGFQGANSMMEYRARMTERYLDDAPRTARK
ncbi:DUF6263 family protein [Stieleria varia]|uniref:DUF6263 family protein n=1 Tax=Stieleria varia TaxID=2528005 RepID=UPI0011B6098E|nr:DUF6263 family protein [Stieleria varia]